MIIGVPKEIKTLEARVALTPAGVRELVKHGHKVIIETNAGLGSAITDADYSAQGAVLVAEAKDVWEQADMIMKVKEPSLEEVEMIGEKMLFTYLHLSSSKVLTEKLLECKTTSFAYETVIINKETPMLKPMSEIAGRLSLLDSIELLKKSKGGKGKLIAGTSLADPANVLIIGAGIVGINAMQMSLGLGANTTILDLNQELLNSIKQRYPAVNIALSSKEYISSLLPTIDIVIGAV